VPLVTYEQARPWAVAIKEQVLARAMPPWGAVKGFGAFEPDGALSQEEILIIAAWVIGGAPKGDPVLLMKPAQQLTRNANPKDILVINGSAVLDEALNIAGIRPLVNAPVSSAKIMATLPNGCTEPLIWLYQYIPGRSNAIFHFRDAVRLPKGTKIEASQPIRFALEG